MADLNSLTSLQTLISTLAGKHESAEAKQDFALASTAISLLAQTLVPRLDPSLNLTAIDAGLAKAFDGITDTVAAIETKLTADPANPTVVITGSGGGSGDADPSTTQTETPANA